MTISKKTQKIVAFLTKHPDASVTGVAIKFGVTKPYIYNLRRKIREGIPPGWSVDLDETTGDVVATHNGRERARVKTAISLGEAPLKKEGGTVAVDPTQVSEVLDTRATQYGTFKDGAELMQSIKRTLAAHAQKHEKTFADDQWEALEMIVHKIARIVNGNPDNHDSWVDIAGYAMLVADRLEGNAR